MKRVPARLSVARYSRVSTRKALYLPLLMLLLASLACSLPTMGQVARTPAPTQPQAAPGATQGVEQPSSLAATQDTSGGPLSSAQEVQPGGPTVPPAPPPSNLPPALVEVQPAPLSELAAGVQPVFYFNQAMDAASVESAFQAQPDLPGKLEWINGSTVRFSPAKPISPDTALNLTIDASAKAANGQSLKNPVQVTYQAAGPLRLAERLPKPGAQNLNPTSAVVVTFNRPVVPLSAEAQASPPAFTLDPPTQGKGEWLNTSTYIFYPQPALNGGTNYTVHIDPNLTGTDGSKLSAGTVQDSLDWTFTTAVPALVSVKPSTEQPILLDDVFVLTFNQPMDTASVANDFSLLGPDGAKVPGEVTWNAAATEMTFKPQDLLQRGSTYTLVLFGTAKGVGGAMTGQDFAANLMTVPALSVRSTRPASGQMLEGYSGYASINLTFSAPVAPGQDLDQLVSIDPPVPNLSVYRVEPGFDLSIGGYFLPGATYTVRVSPDLRDRWGANLGTPFELIVKSKPAAPSLVIPAALAGSQTLFIPQYETSFTAQSTNITRVTLSRGKVTLQDFIAAVQNWQGLQNWQSLVDSTWARLFYPTPNVTEPITLPLTQAGNSSLDPGLYFLKLDTLPAPAEEPQSQAPYLLVVSQTQMTFKVSWGQVFVWATRAADDTPVVGQEVVFYDQTAQRLVSCITDNQGICQASLPRHDKDYQGLYAVIGQPGSPEFSLASWSWSTGVASYDFNIPFDIKDSRPNIYAYTDRPIYQPGQTVYFRVVAKGQENARYFAPNFNQVTVDVIAPYDPLKTENPPLTTLTVPLDIYGSGTGVYTLPDDARVGTYNLHFHESEFQDRYFEVAQYRKPEIDLQVNFAQAGYLTGSDLKAQGMAKYFFGAPAGSVPLKWSLTAHTDYLALPDNLTVGPADMSWMQGSRFRGFPGDWFVMEGQAQTNPDGTYSITINGQNLLERLIGSTDRMLKLTLEVTAEDESGLPVSGRGSTTLHPSPFYVGVRAEQWSVQAGQDINYTVRSVDWQGSPVPAKPLTARFRKVTWNQETTNDVHQPPSYTPEYMEAGSTDFVTSENGEARLVFTPPDPGTYMIEITSQPGSPEQGVLTQDMIWVGGPGMVTWPNFSNQHLLLRTDGEQYKAGDTAHIFIPSPFDQTVALVTVERSKVMRSQVINFQGSSYDLALPLGEDDAPNVYVSVTLLGKTKGRPDFRMGYVNLNIQPIAQTLKVDIATSPQQPQPGSDVTIRIRATDAAGNPVQAEFSLALIDKAVLALARPNSVAIEDAFYDKQPLGVGSSLSLAVYVGRFMYLAPGVGGGGGGGAASIVPVREKFEDTAYWNGAIETDANGEAQVTVKLPDNLTTWHADARGLSEETQVGQAEADLVVGKPLLIRPVAPRFAVVGDHIQLAAIVHNNTGDPQHADVRLEGSGFTLDDPNNQGQAVDLAAGERKRVEWWGTVQDVTALDLTFSTEAGDLRDATRLEGGPLPVLHYAAPQTFATSGVLPGAGQQLEVVSLPRSFTPTGGRLRVEVSPSLTAAVLQGLKALEAYPHDITEPVLSRLLPDLAMLQALNDFQLSDDALRASLQDAVKESVNRLSRMQNQDGGWGWSSGGKSDPYISAYALLGLARAEQAGIPVDGQVIQKALQYLENVLDVPTSNSDAWKLNQLAFHYFVLQQAGRTDYNINPLYDLRERLAPWGKAFLALAIHGQNTEDDRARTLISDLETSAARSATGAHWSDPAPAWQTFSSPNFTTAVVAYAIAKIDPASQVLTDSVRYLALNRRPTGAWDTSYDTAWVLMAMVETVRGTGDLQASYSFTASLNGSPLLQGQVDGPAKALTPVTSTVPLSNLSPDQPNALQVERSEGAGRLYYRAFLQVDRPVQDAPPLQRGMTITRQYYRAGQDCRKETCAPLDSFSLSDAQPVQVRLTLTVPEDMHYVVVEDNFPAGAEVLNPRLNTSQQTIVPEGSEPASPYTLDNPFAEGWGWWLFNDPQVYGDHVRWVVDYLPAGTYELTYRLTPFLAGEFRLLPAHAWEYYFPEIEGTSGGRVIKIQ